eukprot:NODE_712_length_4528_cov_0.399639.p1 type:complete len:529 gc:universal NODE_712_length_4528_cov_0.399639:2012-3598(+)
MLLFPTLNALSDCQNLQQFAINLNMHLVNPVVMNQINTQCCIGFVSGVNCYSGVIDSITWSNYGLNGTMTSFLPSKLTSLDLQRNQLSGLLPTTGYPASLTSLVLNNNQFNGTLPQLPDAMTYLVIESNKFTNFSTLPLNLKTFSASFNLIKRKFPNDLPLNLQYLRLQSNQLYGNISSLPNTLLFIDLCKNSIGGVLPQLPPNLNYLWICTNRLENITYPLPQSLDTFNVAGNFIKSMVEFPPNILLFYADYNLFHGKLPQFPKSLEALSISRNQLSGDISNITCFHINYNSKLTHMILNSNQLTGNMPILPPKLQALLLGDNPMSGPIQCLPNTLTTLLLNGVPFTGSIIMNQPVTLQISSTHIHNVSIQNTYKLTSCDISNTPMLNNPNAALLFPICTHSILYQYTGNTTPTPQCVLPLTSSTSISQDMTQDISIITRNIKLVTHLTGYSFHSVDGSNFTSLVNTTMSLSTIYHFQKHVFEFQLNFKNLIRFNISLIVLCFIIFKSPWKRLKRRKLEREDIYSKF